MNRYRITATDKTSGRTYVDNRTTLEEAMTFLSRYLPTPGHAPAFHVVIHDMGRNSAHTGLPLVYEVGGEDADGPA